MSASEGTKKKVEEMPISFTCPVCGAVSFNPNDIEQKYCGRCHRWQDIEVYARAGCAGYYLNNPARSTREDQYSPGVKGWKGAASAVIEALVAFEEAEPNWGKVAYVGYFTASQGQPSKAWEDMSTCVQGFWTNCALVIRQLYADNNLL